MRDVISKKSALGKRLIDAFPGLHILGERIKETIGEKIESGAEFIEVQKNKIGNLKNRKGE